MNMLETNKKQKISAKKYRVLKKTLIKIKKNKVEV